MSIFVQFKQTPLYERGTCRVCGRAIRTHGHASHAFAHVTRGEARAVLPAGWETNPTWKFVITDKGRTVRAARLRKRRKERT